MVAVSLTPAALEAPEFAPYWFMNRVLNASDRAISMRMASDGVPPHMVEAFLGAVRQQAANAALPADRQAYPPEFAGPEFARYWHMHRVGGASERAIAIRMASDGLPPLMVEAFKGALRQEAANSSSSAAPQPPPPDLAGPEFARYWHMHRVGGASERAIAMRMASDGLPPLMVEAFKGALRQEAAKCSGSAAVQPPPPALAGPEFARYWHMHRVGGASERAIAMRMASDGLPPHMVEAFLGAVRQQAANTALPADPQAYPLEFAGLDFARYWHMHRVGGASERAIAMRMASDGLPPLMVEAFKGALRQEAAKSSSSAGPQAPPPDLAGPEFARYWHMHRVGGASERAIAMRMASDGLPPHMVEAFLTGIQPGARAAPPPSASAAATATLDKLRPELEADGPCMQVPGAVWSCPGLLSPEECMFVLAKAESQGFGCGDYLAQPEGGKRMRTSQCAERMRDPQLAAELAQRIAGLASDMNLPRSLPSGAKMAGVHPHFRIARYCPGDSVAVPNYEAGTFADGELGDSVPALGLVLFLSDGFQGGGMEFPAHDGMFLPPAGGALIFDWQSAGQNCILPVESGTQYILHSAVMFRPAS